MKIFMYFVLIINIFKSSLFAVDCSTPEYQAECHNGLVKQVIMTKSAWKAWHNFGSWRNDHAYIRNHNTKLSGCLIFGPYLRMPYPGNLFVTVNLAIAFEKIYQSSFNLDNSISITGTLNIPSPATSNNFSPDTELIRIDITENNGKHVLNAKYIYTKDISQQIMTVKCRQTSAPKMDLNLTGALNFNFDVDSNYSMPRQKCEHSKLKFTDFKIDLSAELPGGSENVEVRICSVEQGVSVKWYNTVINQIDNL